LDSILSYESNGSVATITMDDGKVNALSLEMLHQVNGALDRALQDEAVVLFTGRKNIFSGGFDLTVLRSGGDDALRMLGAGFDLAERLLSFPRPVVIACNGHAVAMGAFLLLSADYRIGALGPYKITANEVAIGLTLPRAAVEILKQRLTPAAFNRAAILAEIFTPADAVDAGFFDKAVDPGDLPDAAFQIATAMSQLDKTAHRLTKLRARDSTLTALRDANLADADELNGEAAGHAATETTNT